MYRIAGMHAIANIVYIIELGHILAVPWSICYDKLKPLKWTMDRIQMDDQ